MKLQEITDQAQWDAFVLASPYGHPLQLWGWGETKRLNRWTPVRLAVVDGDEIIAGAQVLFWDIPKLGRAIAYIPRGPVASPDLSVELLADLGDYCRLHKALYLRIEPSWTSGAPDKPWRQSHQGILMSQSFTFDLTRAEDELLAQMKHKTRQYVRKSGGELTFELDIEGKHLRRVYEIYEDTAKRAGFGLHGFEYYQTLFGELGTANRLYVARAEEQIVAFLWLAVAGTTAFELYGGVDEQGSELKANYGLKWRAITDLKVVSVKLYDFNGRLEGGVSRFKASFGPDETDYIGTYDLPFNYALYVMWERLWPVAKPIGRRLLKVVKR